MMLARLKYYTVNFFSYACLKKDHILCRINKNLKFNVLDLSVDDYRNRSYAYFLCKYVDLPRILKAHRRYFSKKQRGFGEDAFHAMWFYIFEKYRPVNILEIGVYRGQTLSLFGLLSGILDLDANIVGVSPLSQSGDEFSSYIDIDYEMDIRKNFKHFNLDAPVLLKGFSKEIKIIDYINTNSWDLIYIDGSHHYDDVAIDLKTAFHALKDGGLIVVDDSAVNTNYTPSFYSTRGHSGPSDAIDDFLLDHDDFFELLAVGHNRCFVKIKL